MTGPALLSVVCPTCGVSSPASARFCSSCGARLPVDGVDAHPGPAAPPTAPPTAQPAGLPAERRRVTVLFGDLTDFTGWAEDLDPERVGSVTDQVLAACADAVTDHGGHVDKLTGDGIMALFGAPVAHEDDAARAVAAALAMQAAVRGVVGEILGDRAGATDHADQLGLRVGLNTGVVLAGVQASLAYTVVGDAVNTASRLADVAAVGAVLAGRETALATMGIASWRALPVLTLKGKRETVAAYELLQLRVEPTRDRDERVVGPIFGREREIGQLIGAVVAVSETAAPASIYVSGEAGSGKTRLFTEVAGFVAALPGARVLWGRCAPYGVGRELLPVVDMMRAALGLQQTADADLAPALRASLSALERDNGVPLTSPGLAESILGLLGVAPEGAGSGGLPQGAARREHPRLAAELDAAAAVLRALGASPLMLVVDDLQWAAPALRQALVELTARLSGPVALLGAGRLDVTGDSSPDWWEALPDPQTIELGPLGDPAVEALLRSHLAGASVTPQVTALLLSRAQGNPFFLEELLHLLIDTAVLTRDADDGWVVASDVPGELLPAGVQAVLSARMDALPPAAKAVLRDASVLGTTAQLAGLEVLTRLNGGDAANVPAAVELLVERRLLVAAEGGLPGYSFVHALARDVAYAAIPKAGRALAHAWSARWSAAALPAGAESDQAVATHADRAIALATEMGLPQGDAPWSVRSIGSAAYERLAVAAVGRDDHRTASRLFTRALELSDADAPALLRVKVALASELVALRHTAEAEALLPDALASGDPEVTAGARLVLGEVRRQQARDDEATASWVSAFALASDAGVDRIAGEAIRNLGLQDYFAGRLPAAEERFTTALELARRVGDLRGVGWAHQHLAWSQSSRGAFDAADRALLDAARVFADLEDVGGLAWCAGTEALVRVLQGRLTEGRALIAGLLPSAEDLGDRWVTAACLTIDALAAAELGDLEPGLRGASRAAEMFQALEDPWGEVLALAALGIALRGLGRHPEATEVLRRAIGLVDGTTTPLTGLIAMSALGTVSLERGDLASAELATAQAEALLARITLSPGAHVAVTVLRGQLSRANGDLAGAEALLLAAAAVEDRDAMLFPRRQTLAHLAGVRLERGDVAGARAAASEALMTPAEDIRSRVLALRALGSVRKAEGNVRGAKAAWQEALAVAQSSEASAERETTQRLLDSV